MGGGYLPHSSLLVRIQSQTPPFNTALLVAGGHPAEGSFSYTKQLMILGILESVGNGFFFCTKTITAEVNFSNMHK